MVHGVDGGEPDAENPHQRTGRRSRWWRWVRVVLTLLEILATCRYDVALAAAARATVTIGDAVFGLDMH